MAKPKVHTLPCWTRERSWGPAARSTSYGAWPGSEQLELAGQTPGMCDQLTTRRTRSLDGPPGSQAGPGGCRRPEWRTGQQLRPSSSMAWPRAWGCRPRPRSPSPASPWSIEYPGRVQLVHLDLYRLEDLPRRAVPGPWRDVSLGEQVLAVECVTLDGRAASEGVPWNAARPSSTRARAAKFPPWATARHRDRRCLEHLKQKHEGGKRKTALLESLMAGTQRQAPLRCWKVQGGLKPRPDACSSRGEFRWKSLALVRRWWRCVA